MTNVVVSFHLDREVDQEKYHITSIPGLTLMAKFVVGNLSKIDVS